MGFRRDAQFYRFSAYGFLKNLRFFEPFIILYFRSAGFSFLQIGLLFSIRETATVVLEVPSGFIADVRGRKSAMVISMTAYVLSFTTFFLTFSYAAAIGAMVLFAVGEAFRTGTHKAMILEYLSLTEQAQYKSDYYGATRAASQLGSAVNALIAAALVFASGQYRYVFLAAILPCLLNILNLGTYPAELSWTRAGGSRPGMRRTLKRLASAVGSGEVRLSVLNSATFDAFFKVLKEYLQPTLKALALGMPILMAAGSHRRTAVLVGVVYFLLFLLAGAASRSSGLFGRRAGGLSRAMNLSWLAGVALLAAAGGFRALDITWLSVVAYVALYAVQNLRRPICVSRISEGVHGGVMSTGLSVESLTKTLGMALLAPACGWVADRMGVGVAVLGFGLLLGLLYLPLRMREAGCSLRSPA